MKALMKSILVMVIITLLAFTVVNLTTQSVDAVKSEKDNGTVQPNGDGTSSCIGEPLNC